MNFCLLRVKFYNISGEFVVSETPDSDSFIVMRSGSLKGTLRCWPMLNVEGGLVYEGSV